MVEKKTIETIVPYFARFLEGNVKKEELKDIKGGITHKYPSDKDDVPTLTFDPLD